jgi:hypothetical protein
LHNIDNLLSRHDWETHSSNDPRPERVHFICSRIFQSSSTVRIGEKETRGRYCGTPGLKC